jgi:hypothetical protein
MTVDLLRWPTVARRFQEVFAAAVESFSRQGRSFDYRRSALQQLRERILELPLPDQMEALVVVNNELTEGECVDICFSLRPELN